MSVEKIDTLVVGAGQAGIAMSEHLSSNNIPHLVLERNRIAERWRSERWDSLVTNGPAWHDRFPGLEFSNHGPDEFVPKESVADYFESYATKINAPIRTGVEVTHLEKINGSRGFRVETSTGVIETNNLVTATGPFQCPNIPHIVPSNQNFVQMHSSSYRNPENLPEGNVLVVGSGSSGVQIAEELLQSGKKVYLSVGPHDRLPRRYRDRDYVWWLGVLGHWDKQTPTKGREHVTIAVSGVNGGETIDFRRLAKRGMALVGWTKSYDNGIIKFSPDLCKNVSQGDASYISILDEADKYIERNGLKLPTEPEARAIPVEPDCMINPILSLKLSEARITSIIWATGFSVNYNWMALDIFDEYGQPFHKRGISAEPGIFFLGLPWLSRRGSSFIWGVWHDAKFIADQIVIQHGYQYYDSGINKNSKNS
tara:strand:- start:46 stop:1320 length:1275 start_codon:yes stop_codon:yes gene_type:complete